MPVLGHQCSGTKCEQGLSVLVLAQTNERLIQQYWECHQSRIVGRLPSFKSRRASCKVPAFRSARREVQLSIVHVLYRNNHFGHVINKSVKHQGGKQLWSGAPMYNGHCDDRACNELFIILYAFRLIRQEPLVVKSRKQL